MTLYWVNEMYGRGRTCLNTLVLPLSNVDEL
jgi:hypothetical protein